MRIFESILKIVFVLFAAYLLINNTVNVLCTVAFLLVCLALGATLIFNKKASYNFKQTKKDLMIRRIEGWFLLLFVLASVFSTLWMQ